MSHIKRLSELKDIAGLHEQSVLAGLRKLRAQSRHVALQIGALQNAALTDVQTGDMMTSLAQENWMLWRHGRIQSLKAALKMHETQESALLKQAQRAVGKRQVVEKLIDRASKKRRPYGLAESSLLSDDVANLR